MSQFKALLMPAPGASDGRHFIIEIQGPYVFLMIVQSAPIQPPNLHSVGSDANPPQYNLNGTVNGQIQPGPDQFQCQILPNGVIDIRTQKGIHIQGQVEPKGPTQFIVGAGQWIPRN
jgi:hypothetical protein